MDKIFDISQLRNGTPGKVVGYDELGNPVELDQSEGGGGGPAQIRFRFNSSLFTEDEHLFQGPLTTITASKSNNISSFSYMAKLDDGVDTYEACADITALLAWIATNVTDPGDTYWIQVLVDFGSSVGTGEVLMTYI